MAPQPKTHEKKFVMKCDFADTSVSHSGPAEKHFDLFWIITFTKNQNGSVIGLKCLSSQFHWFVGAKVMVKMHNFELKFPLSMHTCALFNSRNPVHNVKVFSRNELKSFSNKDGILKVEIQVKIDKMDIGSGTDRRFDDDGAKEFLDVALEVKGQKFNVNKMLAQRRQDLANDMQNTIKALRSFQKSRETSEKIQALNDFIEIIQELKDDVFSKFLQVLSSLEDALEDRTKLVSSKPRLESLKSLLVKLESHLKVLDIKGAGIMDPKYVAHARQPLLAAKTQIDRFLEKIPMKQKSNWEKADVDNLKQTINNLAENIDDIDFVSSSLNEAFKKLTIGATSQLSLK